VLAARYSGLLPSALMAVLLGLGAVVLLLRRGRRAALV
jgi:hypothetical protein